LLTDSQNSISPKSSEKLLKQLHLTIKSVTQSIQKYSYNTALARIMELVNLMYEIKKDRGEDQNIWPLSIKTLTQLIAPFAPHLAEEIWHEYLKEEGSIHNSTWPAWDDKLIRQNEVTVVVQVNGKLRAQISLTQSAAKDQPHVETVAKNVPQIQKHLEAKTVKNVIFVPSRLINFVI